MSLLPSSPQNYCLLIPETPPDCSYAHSYDRNCRCTPRRQRRRCRVRTDTFEIQACFTPQQSCETPCNCSGFNTPYSYTSNCQKNCFQTPQVTGWSSPFNCCTPNCFTPRSQPCSPTVKCRRRRRRCPRKCCKTNAPPIMAAKVFPSDTANLNPVPLKTSSSMQFVESQVGVTQYEGCRVGSGQVTQSCTVLDVEPGCCYPQSDALPVHSPSGAFTPRSCDFSRSPSPVPFRVLNRLTGCSAVQNSCTPPPRPPPPNFQRQCQLPCQGPPPRPPSPKPCGRKPPCLRLPSPCIGVGRQMRNSCCCSPICCIPSSLGYNGCQPLMYSIGQNNCGYPMQNSSCCPKTLYLIEKSFRLPNGCSNQSCCPSACCNFPRPPPAVHIPPPPGIYRPPPPGGTRPPPLFFQPPIPTVFGPPAVPLNISPDYYPPLITPFSYPPPPFIPPRTPVTQPSFPKCDRPSIIFDVPNVPSFGVVTPPPAEYFPPPSRTCCCKPPPNDYGCCCRPNQKDTSCCMKPSQCDICCATQKSRVSTCTSRCSVSPSGRPPWGSRPVNSCGSGSCGRPRLPTPDPGRRSSVCCGYRPQLPVSYRCRRTPSYDPSYNTRSPSCDPCFSRSPSYDLCCRRSPSYDPCCRRSPSYDPCCRRSSPCDPYGRSSPSCDPLCRSYPSCDPFGRSSLSCNTSNSSSYCDPYIRNSCDDCCCPPIPKPCPPGCCTISPDPCDPCPQPVICCCPSKKKRQCVPEEKRIIVKQCFNTCPVCDPCECLRQNQTNSYNRSCCCCGSIQQGVDLSYRNQPNRCMCCTENCNIPYRNYTYCTTTLN